MSMHNYIIGTPYIDLGETLRVTRMGTNLVCTIDFERRGWFGKEICKLEGKVTKTEGTKASKPYVLITGNWNAKVYVQSLLPQKGNSECVWTKAPYPEKVDFMYGMSRFSL